MSDRITEAPDYYRTRPWITMALGCGVAVVEQLDRPADAARAIVRRHRVEAIRLIAARAPAAVLAEMLRAAAVELHTHGVARAEIDAALAQAQSELRS